MIWDDSDVDEQLERNPLPYIMRVDIGLFGKIASLSLSSVSFDDKEKFICVLQLG